MAQSNLKCLDCESRAVNLFINDPFKPTQYYYECEDCSNCSKICDNMFEAEKDWLVSNTFKFVYECPNAALRLQDKIFIIGTPSSQCGSRL